MLLEVFKATVEKFIKKELKDVSGEVVLVSLLDKNEEKNERFF